MFAHKITFSALHSVNMQDLSILLVVYHASIVFAYVDVSMGNINSTCMYTKYALLNYSRLNISSLLH